MLNMEKKALTFYVIIASIPKIDTMKDLNVC